MFILNLFPSAGYSDFFWKDDFLTDEEIKRVLEMGERGNWHAGEVLTAGESEYNQKHRHASVCSMSLDEENYWLFDKLGTIITQCNHAKYNFDVTGIFEPIGLVRYTDGCHFDWHKDHGSGIISVRKLSLVVQLSHPEDYEGGDLEFFGDVDTDQTLRQRGTVIIFPSFIYHRVTPVTAGTRTSLVAWFSGPPFR